MKTVFSGIKPSGNLHLGNYLGAIKQWVGLQDKYNCIFSVVDMHAITVPQKPEELRKTIKEIVAIYIACGIDPEKVILSQQSRISEHAELGWILNCITPVSWLDRMTQYKDKSKKYGKEKVGMGLYDYPVLMAADILLYHTDLVPVGDDQKQHVELTRDIAGAFNRRYNIEHFNLPECMRMGEATRVMSLKDGTKKMSKSDESGMGCVYLTDDRDLIAKKFKRAKTDSIAEFSYDKETRSEVTNLINIYSEFSGEKIEDILNRFNGQGFGKFKGELAGLVIENIAPIGDKIKELMKNPDYLEGILIEHSLRAKEIASENFKRVKEITGLI